MSDPIQYQGLFKAPEVHGYYMMGPPPFSVSVALYDTPSRFHRFMVRLIFGWTWKRAQ